MAQFGYTDDELMEWRRPFDEFATEKGIDFSAFEHFVTQKYRGVIPEEQLSQKVQLLWKRFDQDGNNYIDFGEFIVVGLLFDVASAKERVRREGVEEAFQRYSEDGFMAEPNVFQLMLDFDFFVSTATDVRKFMRIADCDGDGLVSLADFEKFVRSEDFVMESRKSRRRGGGAAGKQRARPARPPPEPEG